VRLLAVAVLAIVAAGGAATVARASTVEGPIGRGGDAVWIVWPAGEIRSVVVFGHGWKAQPPSAAHPWVGQFRPWLDHLAANGSAVVFPRYQLGGDLSGVARVTSYRHGLARAFARLAPIEVPVVVAGYSYGASLAFSYAANARAWGLPAPSAVDAVFPAGPVPGSPLPRLAPTVRVLIQVGAQDTEAGRGGADSFWAWLHRHPAGLKRYAVVASTAGLTATHAAPKLTTPAAQRVFWTPLDALVAAVR
jgi:hypothetical protein